MTKNCTVDHLNWPSVSLASSKPHVLAGEAPVQKNSSVADLSRRESAVVRIISLCNWVRVGAGGEILHVGFPDSPLAVEVTVTLQQVPAEGDERFIHILAV